MIVTVKVKVKGSVTGQCVAPRVPGCLGSQITMTFGILRWWGCQPHAPAAFTPRKGSWYSFSVGAESTPGPWYGQKEYVTEKIQWHRQESIPGLVARRLSHYATPGPRPPCRETNIYVFLCVIPSVSFIFSKHLKHCLYHVYKLLSKPLSASEQAIYLRS
jgi:hypothetical protein